LKKLQDFTTLSLHSIQTLSEVNRETKNLTDEEKKGNAGNAGKEGMKGNCTRCRSNCDLDKSTMKF
jgi:hypothetical protein